MITAVEMALLIFVSYTIVAVNTCAIARAKYLPTIISSVLFMLVNFTLIKHVAEATTAWEFVAYVIGGVCGDVAGIFISKKWRIS